MNQILNPHSPLAHEVVAPELDLICLPRNLWRVYLGGNPFARPRVRPVVEAGRPFWAPKDPPSMKTVRYVQRQLAGFALPVWSPFSGYTDGH